MDVVDDEGIPPLEGVDRLAAALDALAARPVARRRLPVLLFQDDAGLGARFVTAYADRLRTADGQGIVPHAVIDAELLARADAADEPDVVLADHIARRLAATMPHTARGLALPTYWTCREVLRTDAGIGSPHEQRAALAGALCAQWQARTPGLGALQEFVRGGGAGPLGQRLSSAVTILVAIPLQWAYSVWLDRTGRLRWYAQQVCLAGEPCDGFLAAATHLALQGTLRDNAALRQSLLLEALAIDLTQASRRKPFSPRRRRRVWPFTILLPDADSPRGSARRLLDALLALQARERKREWPLRLRRRRLPLLCLAARTAAPPAGTAAQSPRAAADALQRLNTGKGKPLPAGAEHDGQVTVELQGPPRESVRSWLERHIAVRPRRVRRPSAFLGWLVASALLVAAYPAGVVAQRVLDPCQGTWAVGGTRVGVDTAPQGAPAQCYFTQAANQKLLRELQRQIRDENVQAQEDGAYSTVVFLAPLTADPDSTSGQLTPAGVLQLQGAARAQARYNEQARIDPSKPRLRMLVANVGHAFAQWPGVVDRVRELVAGDPTVSAVIGIAQSRQQSVDTINHLPHDMPVIGSSVTGDFMTTETSTYFQTQPTSRRMARAMARRVLALQRTKALVVYDDHDRYSLNLKEDLYQELTGLGVTMEQPAVIRDVPKEGLGQRTRLDQLATRVCSLGHDGGITVYAARGNALPKVLYGIQAQCGAGSAAPIPFLSSDVNTLIEYPELTAFAHLERYTAVNLEYVAFSPRRHSDTDAGSDAFRAAATAIDLVWSPANPPRASNVLQQLTAGITVKDNIDPDRPFTIPPFNHPPAHRPLFLCTVPHLLGAVPLCSPANGEKETP